MDNTALLERTKSDIRSVLITAQQGLILREFLKFYRELTSGDIPYRRLGYSSAVELLERCDGVCRCQRLANGHLLLTAVCDQSTSHVKRLVDRSRSQPNRATRAALTQCQGRATRTPFTQSHGLTPRRPIQPLLPPTDRVFNSPQLRPTPGSSGTLPPEHRYYLLKLLAKHPLGMHIDDLCELYETDCGMKLDYLSMGYQSLLHLLESVPELVRVKHTEVGTKVLPIALPGSSDQETAVQTGPGLLRSPPSPSHEQNNFLQSDVDTLKPLKADIIRVLREEARPVVLIDLPIVFRRRLGHQLVYMDFGFSCVLDALFHLGAPLVLSKHQQDWYCSLSSEDEDGGMGSTRVLYESAADPPLPVPAAAGDRRGSSAALHIDTQCFRTGASVAGAMDSDSPVDALHRFQADAPGLLQPDGTQEYDHNGFPLIYVFVMRVLSPTEFVYCTYEWQVRRLALQDAMNRLYGNMLERTRLRVKSRGCGQSLAVLHQDNWLRAVVVSEVFEQFRVYLVDVGVEVCVSVDNACLLVRRFSDIPLLCAQGELADVRPAGGVESTSWSRAATELFSGFFSPDIAVAASIRRQDQCCSVLRLCDTSTVDDIYVCDTLIDSGYASRLQSVDPPPAAISATVPTVLSKLYSMLDGNRVPPEGEELSPAPQVSPTLAASVLSANCVDASSRIIQLKAQCYDLQQQLQLPMPARLGMLNKARIKLLQEQIAQLQLTDV